MLEGKWDEDHDKNKKLLYIIEPVLESLLQVCLLSISILNLEDFCLNLLILMRNFYVLCHYWSLWCVFLFSFLSCAHNCFFLFYKLFKVGKFSFHLSLNSMKWKKCVFNISEFKCHLSNWHISSLILKKMAKFLSGQLYSNYWYTTGFLMMGSFWVTL